ncbi:hypothetical protein OHC33_004052 [Knufia fluminis]|uniref:Uncharacterized protein n=1 Tax=Knufia fluminis TaxID=191047 RepID=A0AAN8I737_9EURO|nr:hypothetical protein OHC33_004052 [Knufia fluminis]
MSYVDKELQRTQAQPICADIAPHQQSPPNQTHEVEDRFHQEYTQTWTAVNSKRSATPPSHFSDPQTRDLLGDGPTVISNRSAVEQRLDELGIYRDADVDPSKVQHSYGLHPSVEADQQHSPEIADSEDQDVVDDSAMDDFSEFLADHVNSSPQESSFATQKPQESGKEDEQPVTKTTRSRGGRKSKSSEKHTKNSHISKPPARKLRERTLRQEMPFKIDKVEQSLARKGVKTTESDLEEELYEQIHATKKKTRQTVSKESKKKPKKSTRRPLAERKNLPSPTPTPSAFTDIYEDPEPEPDVLQTIIRTRLDGFGKGHLPIVLSSSHSTSALFEAIAQKWRSGLKGRNINHCIISFPWLATLGEDDNIVMFGENDDDVYTCMLKKIREAPTWKEVGRCEIDLMIYPDEKD